MSKRDWVDHFDRLARAKTESHEVNGFKSKSITNKIRNCVKEAIQRENPKLIYDVGCGDGSVTAAFTNSVDVIGIDGSINMLRLAEKKGLSTRNKHFSEISNLDFEDKEEDVCILLCECLVCADDPIQFLDKIAKICQEKGYALILSIPSSSSFIRKLYKLLIQEDIQMPKLSKVFNLLSDSFELTYSMVMPFGSHISPRRRLAYKLLKPMATNIVITARVRVS